MADDFNMNQFLKETTEKLEQSKNLIQDNNFDSISDNEDLYFAISGLMMDKDSDEMQLQHIIQKSTNDNY